MRRMTPRRGGFTLVEVLVVVAVLALLAALAAAAFLRVRGSEEVRASEATLSKLKTGLDRKWKAVLDDAAGDSTAGRIPASVLTFADNDKDRARAIWTYCRLRNEFPTTITEACNPTTTFGGPALPPKSIYLDGFRKLIQPISPTTVPAKLSTVTVTSTVTPTESAACFQWALTAAAVRGETFADDGTSQQTGDVPVDISVSYTYPDPTNPSNTLTGTGKITTLRAFKDAYGQPIAFVRMGYAGELNGSQYTKPSNVAGNTVLARDPFDPKGRLPTIQDSTASPGWNATKLQQFWTTVTSNHLGYQWQPPQASTAATFPKGATAPSGSSMASDTYPFTVSSGQPSMQPWNCVPTLIAVGPDKAFDFPTGSLGGGDDLVSFRLAREGNKGN